MRRCLVGPSLSVGASMRLLGLRLGFRVEGVRFRVYGFKLGTGGGRRDNTEGTEMQGSGMWSPGVWGLRSRARGFRV